MLLSLPRQLPSKWHSAHSFRLDTSTNSVQRKVLKFSASVSGWAVNWLWNSWDSFGGASNSQSSSWTSLETSPLRASKIPFHSTGTKLSTEKNFCVFQIFYFIFKLFLHFCRQWWKLKSNNQMSKCVGLVMCLNHPTTFYVQRYFLLLSILNFFRPSIAELIIFTSLVGHYPSGVKRGGGRGGIYKQLLTMLLSSCGLIERERQSLTSFRRLHSHNWIGPYSLQF